MTDLELTRLCAEAMSYDETSDVRQNGRDCIYLEREAGIGTRIYDPLHDDTQCFALVRRFALNIGQTTQGVKVFTTPFKGGFHEADDPDINRAVVKCIAEMQAQKHSADLTAKQGSTPDGSPDEAPAKSDDFARAAAQVNQARRL